MNPIYRFYTPIRKLALVSTSTPTCSAYFSRASSKFISTDRSGKNGDDEWNDAWETAWLPEDLSAKNRAPWETDVNFSSSSDSPIVLPSDADPETKAFVEDMNDNWDQRRKNQHAKQQQEQKVDSSLYSMQNMKKDYRFKKQRIHSGLWMKEIEKQDEAKLASDLIAGGGDDIEKLLDSCSDIFDTANIDLNTSKIPGTSEFKSKPDGWETASKAQDGNIWEMSQKEEDILIQEFERRISYCRFQAHLIFPYYKGSRESIIASFIKTHIFSRRRPIDGWKYMIEEIGPNARKGKGTVSRIPSLSDPSTQPYKEERMPIASGTSSFRRE
ncbi:hypothetical protein RJ641_019249 [Dillenia turbinata]|uniref:Mucin-like protein n=1 Tax=Dillenia turbinata TaxID=194707 RepID=A0AAN8UGI7_9MAGN